MSHARALRSALAAAATVGATGCGAVFDYPVPTAETCDNGRDDDLDGATDCDDAECRATPACTEGLELCANGLDDDRDGRTDCEDDDCATGPACAESDAERCANGLDDDGDGATDCDDAGCDGLCPEEGPRCFDGRDNDGDGAGDHLDAACWQSAADLSLDRCAAVAGGTTDLGARAGIDWIVDEMWDAPHVIPLDGGKAALAGPSVVAARPATGALDGTSVTVHVVVSNWEVEHYLFGPYVNLSLASTFGEELRLRLSLGDSGYGFGWLDLSGDEHGTSTDEVELAPVGSPVRWIEAEIRLDLVVATRSYLADVRLDGGAWSGGFTGPLPAGWSDSEPLVLRWGSEEAGLASARITRETFTRCGTELPDPGMGDLTVTAATFADGDDLCVIARPASDGPASTWRSRVTRLPSGGAELGGFDRASDGADVADLRLLAWDPGRRELRGVAQDVSPSGAGRPTLVRAPRCAGPWEVVGPALAREPDRPVIAVAYGAARRYGETTGHAILYSDGPLGPLVEAVGDGEARSFAATGRTFPGSAPGLEVPTGAPFGRDWILAAAATAGALEVQVLRPGGTGSPVATLSASRERGTFDRLGAFPRAVAIDPAPPQGEARALVFYAGCTSDRCGGDVRTAPAWLSVRRRSE